ncbi:exodeoxyribonuclease VII large subunit [Lysinibacillus odysseyi]|uniref:Exodeoxyribonuclease 7 large subunit n=1 Tax=Lysinibacillus odysseyi 34hs-1 = NBRC 100172 TaxID=1220589 RepID=A0A0A3IA52_9BACI|nr:exodeoxyribonuclease VII large subunit [Lysinibacillus odysseyi]KGR81619.1 exodeoxyribonuclease VII large subunit [Lysinibacillus odysseyi 34hs-1 = NBRC 100172]
MSSSYLTVKALTKYIKRKFEADPHLREVYVKGELSNVKIHTSGHIYFTLKDDGARINATMFRNQAARLSFRPEEGMQVFIRGDVNVYEVGGTYQLYAQTMEPDGVGGLFIAFNQLKERLQKEGLFNPNFKQPIPLYPQTIGVLTATTGAAIRDICTTIGRRYRQAEICVYPTLVQGAGAAADIAKNIQLANKQAMCDVLIVGRGGGSIEDLWAFNEEIVARAIFESRIPIISAVGHETDTTIADFVADLRAPTPTAAAEMAVPNRQELYQRVLKGQSHMHQMMTARLHFERTRLTKLQNAYPLAMPERLYRPFTEKLAQMDTQLQNSTSLYFMKQRNVLERLQSHLRMQSPQQQVSYEKRQLDTMTQQLTKAVFANIQQNKQQFDSVIRTLSALNPLAIMHKGFNVSYKNGQVVKSVEQLSPDDVIDVTFHDGAAKAKILEVEKKGE